MPTVETTIEFIKKPDVHGTGTDKSGNPYFEHPIAVMNELPPFASPDLKQAALLHDVLEDTRYTRQDLESMGYSVRTLDTVEAVTQKDPPKETTKDWDDAQWIAHYHDSVAHTVQHGTDDAVLLKFADMTQNLDPERVRILREKSPEKADRFALKYGKPYKLLAECVQRIAETHGYELNVPAEFTQTDTGLTVNLTAKPRWLEKNKWQARHEDKPPSAAAGPTP